MISFDGCRVVDLSPRLVSRVKRLDGTIEEGTADPYGLPWCLEEIHVPYDDTLATLVGLPPGDEVWPLGRCSGHFGAHTEAGKGHMDHWDYLPEGVKGLWEYPLETFFGEAAVCNMKDLPPVETTNSKGETVMRGQPIRPEHLANVREGDIVMLCSPYRGAEQPYLPGDTAEWLATQKPKLLAVGYPGVQWETDFQLEQPHNSPTHRHMLGNNIPIAYPLANVDTLTQDRVFYLGLPLNFERMEATYVRAIAVEQP